MSEYARELEDDSFAGSMEAVAGVVGWLGSAESAELTHAQLEEQLSERVREIRRLLYQDHLDLRAVREPRLAGVMGPEGAERTRAEPGHSRLLATTAGQVRVTRIAYRAPGVPNVHPADAQLSLPPGKHSHGLGKLLAIEAPRGSIAQACAAVQRATGVRLGTRQATGLICRAACDFSDFYEDREHRPPPRAAPGTVLALSCDAKAIMVRPGQQRPIAARRARKSVPRQEGRLSRGEVGTRKRMAEVGAVFDIVPAPRTAQDILVPARPRPAAPRATSKWVTASVADDAAQVVAAVFAEADRRDPDQQRTWIALADGNVHQLDRIRAEAAARGITISIICDVIHVLEHLWDAAWGLFPEASPDAAPWVRARARAILRGHARPVAAAIRDAITARQLTPAQRKQASTAADYLDAKAPYLNYPAALRQGWPISSGVIEGTCRHLVKDRMAITGARWGIDTAEAILKLRALHANGDFDAYWTYHLQHEHQRNHPHSNQHNDQLTAA